MRRHSWTVFKTELRRCVIYEEQGSIMCFKIWRWKRRLLFWKYLNRQQATTGSARTHTYVCETHLMRDSSFDKKKKSKEYTDENERKKTRRKHLPPTEFACRIMHKIVWRLHENSELTWSILHTKFVYKKLQILLRWLQVSNLILFKFIRFLSLFTCYKKVFYPF